MKEELLPKKKKKQNKKNPRIHLADKLQRVSGVDLTRIDGVDVMVVQTVISEVGLDMSRWKTEAPFASWLGLCPDNRISEDKALSPPAGTDLQGYRECAKLNRNTVFGYCSLIELRVDTGRTSEIQFS